MTGLLLAQAVQKSPAELGSCGPCGLVCPGLDKTQGPPLLTPPHCSPCGTLTGLPLEPQLGGGPTTCMTTVPSRARAQVLGDPQEDRALWLWLSHLGQLQPSLIIPSYILCPGPGQELENDIEEILHCHVALASSTL